MDRLNKGNAPDLKSFNKLTEMKIKRDVQSNLSNEVSGKFNPELNSKVNKVNTRIEDKRIVNNKPSQFGPILGVNFHMIKR